MRSLRVSFGGSGGSGADDGVARGSSMGSGLGVTGEDVGGAASAVKVGGDHKSGDGAASMTSSSETGSECKL